MIKKIKDLDQYDVEEICQYYGKGNCTDKCPLYRISKTRRRLCFIIVNKTRCNAKEKERMEKEVKWKTN
jgi:hypothetical protein